MNRFELNLPERTRRIVEREIVPVERREQCPGVGVLDIPERRDNGGNAGREQGTRQALNPLSLALEADAALTRTEHGEPDARMAQRGQLEPKQGARRLPSI